MDLLAMRTCALLAESKRLREAIREASIGRVRPKLMTAATAIRGLLPILLLRMHGTEIERPLAIVMIRGLATSTIFILLVLQRFIRKLQTGRREWTAPHACYL
jgi:cobalt-zinc-cadmium resistance protein CzcA